ncbi:MAG: hypothetical protein ACR2FQ_11425 [Pseudonocardiaceae bacterium]
MRRVSQRTDVAHLRGEILRGSSLRTAEVRWTATSERFGIIRVRRLAGSELGLQSLQDLALHLLAFLGAELPIPVVEIGVRRYVMHDRPDHLLDHP